MRIPLVSLAFGILMAVVASQLPEFAQQYRQRLGGVIDELSRQVSQFQAEADAEKLSKEAAIARLQKNSDNLAQKHGSDMTESLSRLLRLESQQESFKQAGPFNRILVMFQNFDPSTAKRALQFYEPAVPTTAEGLVTTIIGFFFGGGLLRLLGMPFRRRGTPQPAYASGGPTPPPRDELTRAEAIRLRQRVNKATLPRPGLSRDRREV